MSARSVSGRRVYVTFLHDGTIAVHPSNCTASRYRMRGEGSVHLSKTVSDEDLGRAVRDMRSQCKTSSET